MASFIAKVQNRVAVKCRIFGIHDQYKISITNVLHLMMAMAPYALAKIAHLLHSGVANDPEILYACLEIQQEIHVNI